MVKEIRRARNEERSFESKPLTGAEEAAIESESESLGELDIVDAVILSVKIRAVRWTNNEDEKKQDLKKETYSKDRLGSARREFVHVMCARQENGLTRRQSVICSERVRRAESREEARNRFRAKRSWGARAIESHGDKRCRLSTMLSARRG